MDTNSSVFSQNKNSLPISGVSYTIDDNNEVADVKVEYSMAGNPTLKSPNTPFEQPFLSDKDTFMDVDEYKAFVENCISRFRHSATYKNYKHYLYDIGLNRCQLMGNITSDMGVAIEMHHNFLNIFDITVMITEHMINTVGYCTTFDVVQALKEEHKNNNIPIVMLSKTAHQLYHNSNSNVFIPARMCFGFWYELLQKYNRGITLNIAQKVVTFIQGSIDYEQQYLPEEDMTRKLLQVRENVEGWSKYNEYADYMPVLGVVY